MRTKTISLFFAILLSLPLAAQVSKTKQTKKVQDNKTVQKEQLDRSKQPAAAPAPVIKIGEYQSFELPNGLKVFVVENHKIPRVSYSLVLDYAPILEGADAGYVDFAGQLMRTGTLTRTKDQIDEAVDFIGASFDPSADGFSASCLSKHNEELLGIMSDVVMNATFKQEELEKIRTQTLSGLEAEKNDPSAIATRVSAKLVYGATHPYGETMNEESVKKITLEKCNEFYKNYYKPNVGYLAIVGDITLAQAKPLIEKYFGGWQRGDVPTATYTTPKAPAKTVVAIVDRPNAVQSTLNVAYPLDLKPNSEDVIKAQVTNTVLGGGTFRLFNNLREKHGWTYGCYSSLAKDKLIGRFTASAEVRNPVTDSSLTQIIFEMGRLRTEPVPDAELNMVKNYMMGNFGRSLENPVTVANFAINTARYNLPKDYYANYLTNMSAVTSADVQAMAQKYIKPDNAYILVVGKAEEVASKLSQFSKGSNIQYYDIDGNFFDPSVKIKPAPAGVTAETVISNFVTASGGAKKLAKIKDLTMHMTSSMQGMTLSFDFFRKAPNKYVVQVSMGPTVVQKQVFDGTRGRAISPMQGEDKELDGKELEAMKYEAILNPELDYAAHGFKAVLLGMEEIKGTDAYKIEVTYPNGSKKTDYYDVASALLIRSIGDNGVTELSDYRAVDGIMFPYSLNQEMGPQTMKLVVASIEMNTKMKDDVFLIK
jgi:zinc protease